MIEAKAGSASLKCFQYNGYKICEDYKQENHLTHKVIDSKVLYPNTLWWQVTLEGQVLLQAVK